MPGLGPATKSRARRARASVTFRLKHRQFGDPVVSIARRWLAAISSSTNERDLTSESQASKDRRHAVGARRDDDRPRPTDLFPACLSASCSVMPRVVDLKKEPTNRFRADGGIGTPSDLCSLSKQSPAVSSTGTSHVEMSATEAVGKNPNSLWRPVNGLVGSSTLQVEGRSAHHRTQTSIQSSD